ncbi:putative serine threonine protein kinase protein [Daldinia childiae]|uniref:putative serine threonine protein kinase protein n=1 Tax=Daldinia childiae TaxID=326645 RepID=UPI00144670C8|nr:putative serine threonine protein kinase protein [Daldinia childiae]KAF3062487.1 putative serine threonine protein kinase protein [Daldinia childiae]
MIEKHMLLLNANNHYNAKQLKTLLNEIFDLPNDQNHRLPLDTLPSDILPMEPERGLCLTALGEHIAKLQSTSGFSARRPRDAIDIEINELVDGLKSNVPGRHHIFFFNDSTTMENYRRELGLIEPGFGQLVDSVLIPYLPIRKSGVNFNLFANKPTSIYVFTDGDWGDDQEVAYRVERPIERLNKGLQEQKLDKNHISFHFVRFGDSANGKAYLNHLDSFGRDDNWDNSDIKTVFSPVKYIIIGPLV